MGCSLLAWQRLLSCSARDSSACSGQGVAREPFSTLDRSEWWRSLACQRRGLARQISPSPFITSKGSWRHQRGLPWCQTHQMSGLVSTRGLMSSTTSKRRMSRKRRGYEIVRGRCPAIKLPRHRCQCSCWFSLYRQRWPPRQRCPPRRKSRPSAPCRREELA